MKSKSTTKTVTAKKASAAPKPKPNATKPTAAVKQPGEEFDYVNLASITPDPHQPRKLFDAAKLNELTESIRERGVETPILLRPLSSGKFQYQIVFGERRWRAAKAAGLKQIPARIRVMSDAQAAESQLVENTQRDDMTPMEEAQAFERLRAQFNYSIEELILKSGKSEKLVRQRLRLNLLPPDAQTALLENRLRLGVANAIVWIDNVEDRRAATHHILTNTWNNLAQNVHQAEEYIQRHYLLQLSKAPFSTRDEKLHPPAGSCIKCPKRTGATGALFEDLGVKDSCLDSGCYQEKVQLHRAAQVAKLSAAHPVVDEETTKRIFRHSQDDVDSSSGFVNLTAVVYQDPKQRTWGELIGEAAPVQVAVNEAGKSVKVLKRAEAVKLAKEHANVDLDAKESGSRSDALARKKARARVSALNEFLVALTAHVEVTTRDHYPPAQLPFLRALGNLTIRNAPNDSCRYFVKRRELPIVHGQYGGPDYRATCQNGLDALDSPSAVLALIAELIVLENFQYWVTANSTGKIEAHQKQLGELIGFDLAEAVKDQLKELTAPKAVKAKAAPSKRKDAQASVAN
jgi:ParB/RepB/Spo0J family partition protein